LDAENLRRLIMEEVIHQNAPLQVVLQQPAFQQFQGASHPAPAVQKVGSDG